MPRPFPSAAFRKKYFIYAFLYAVTMSMLVSTLIFQPYPGNDYPLLRLVIVFFSSVLLTKYFLYMLISPWHEAAITHRLKKRGLLDKPYEPLVSVVIPEWNEAVGIVRTMESVLASDYPKLELVVVNDGSTDNSGALIEDFMKKFTKEQRFKSDGRSAKIVYISQENGGKGAALNTGIKKAKGDIIITIDADCCIEPDAVSHFVHMFRDPEVMAAVGNVKIGNTQRLIGVIQELEFLFSFYFKKADSLMGTIYIIGGAAGAFRREVFEKIGPYSTSNITEDIELSVRIQEAGMKIVYASQAIVYTEGASDLRSLMKQRLRWKRGRFETFLAHKNLFFSVKQNRNKLLTCFILPFAYFGEVQLSLELGFLAFLYIYSFLINDFSSFIPGIIIVGSMFAVQLFESRGKRPMEFYIVAPIGWLLFYVASFVEIVALFKSVWGLATKQTLRWQRWDRAGVDGGLVT